MTTPYIPQHNGLAERKNRTLVDMVNAMLLNANYQIIYGVKPYLLHVTFIIEYYLKNQMFLPMKHETVENQI
jgi:hypothetical protein